MKVILDTCAALASLAAGCVYGAVFYPRMGAPVYQASLLLVLIAATALFGRTVPGREVTGR